MTVLKALLASLLLVVLLGLVFLVYAWRPEIAALIEADAAPSFEKSLIKRGR